MTDPQPKHSDVIGGSSAERRIQCTGSAALESSLPKDESSVWANEGTALHELMRRALDEGELPPDEGEMLWVTEEGADVKLSADALERFWVAWAAINEYMDKYGIESYDLDLRYDHHETCGPDVFGETDFAAADIFNNKRRAHIVDLKFGQGIKARAKENRQLAFYAVGMIQNDDPYVQGATQFVLTIIQPWYDESEPTIDSWETDITWLRQYEKMEQHAYERIKSGDTALKTGSWCQFCRAAAICPAQQKNLETFDSTVKPEQGDPGPLDTTKLSLLLEMGKTAVKQYDALLEYATRLAEQGVKIPNWKLVESRGNRRYKDETKDAAEELAVSLVGSDAHTSKLKTPAQLKKACEKHKVDFKVMEQYIERPFRGGRLVPDSHPGAEMQHATAIELPIEPQPLQVKAKAGKP